MPVPLKYLNLQLYDNEYYKLKKLNSELVFVVIVIVIDSQSWTPSPLTSWDDSSTLYDKGHSLKKSVANHNHIHYTNYTCNLNHKHFSPTTLITLV